MISAALLQGCGAPAPPPTAPVEPVALTALAASSLTDVLPEIAEAWKAHGATTTVTFSFDSSSKLIKQIEAGAPADLLFTADPETMSHVADLGLLAPGTRRDLVGNALVLVVPSTATTQPPSSAADLGSVVHLALAGENVPAGKYARAALEHAGVWTSVEPRIVRGDNVRTTLGWVTRGEADAGVVYLTDAQSEPAVRVAFTFPADSHPPIVYPGAVVAASPHVDRASSFLSFCSSAEAMAISSEHGFTPPPATP
jgi:molybdate transport system substrate-binding protein